MGLQAPRTCTDPIQIDFAPPPPSGSSIIFGTCIYLLLTFSFHGFWRYVLFIGRTGRTFYRVRAPLISVDPTWHHAALLLHFPCVTNFHCYFVTRWLLFCVIVWLLTSLGPCVTYFFLSLLPSLYLTPPHLHTLPPLPAFSIQCGARPLRGLDD